MLAVGIYWPREPESSYGLRYVIFDLAPMNYACCSFGSIEPFWNLSERKRGYTPYRHQTDIRGVPVGGVGLRAAVTAGEWLYSQVTQW